LSGRACGDHGVELLGDLADGCWADRPTQDRQQRLADLARRQPQHKARQDHPIDLLGAPGIRPHNADRREPPGARHPEFDVAQLAQQMTRVGAVAPVSLVERRHPLQVLIDRLVHLAAHKLGDRVPPERPIALAPFQPLRLHALHQLECSR
jgi:hypothetical protein